MPRVKLGDVENDGNALLIRRERLSVLVDAPLTNPVQANTAGIHAATSLLARVWYTTLFKGCLRHW